MKIRHEETHEINKKFFELYVLEEIKRGRIRFEILSKNQKSIHLHRLTNGGDETKGSKWRTFTIHNSIENMKKFSNRSRW